MSKSWNSFYVLGIQIKAFITLCIYSPLANTDLIFQLTEEGRCPVFLSTLGLEIWSIHSNSDHSLWDF